MAAQLSLEASPQVRSRARADRGQMVDNVARRPLGIMSAAVGHHPKPGAWLEQMVSSVTSRTQPLWLTPKLSKEGDIALPQTRLTSSAPLPGARSLQSATGSAIKVSKLVWAPGAHADRQRVESSSPLKTPSVG